MKKGISFVLITILLAGLFTLPASAQPLTLDKSLTGEVLYPEGSTVDNAKFLITYTYPQITPESETDKSINTYYQELEEDLLKKTAPELYDQASGALDADVSGYMHLSYQVTANTNDFFSVVLSREEFMGVAESQTIQANVFARAGDSAGGLVTLPTVLGISDDDEVDATNLVDSVYQLVWDIIVEQMQTGTVEYFEELTEENLFSEFHPESDFYLDEKGNIVFYVQPSTIASGAAGLLTFPFSPAELMSEIPKG
jgi:hypothetical protein